MVNEQGFRSDLYYRLNGFTIHLPPLRSRKEDIEKLTMTFIFSICRRENAPVKGLVPETLETLVHYSWPGNVREFKQVLEKAILEDMQAPTLYPMHLPAEIRIHRIHSQVSRKKDTSGVNETLPAQEFLDEPETLPEFKEYKKLFHRALERRYLERLLQDSTGDIGKARKISGLSRSRLYDLLKSHSLLPPSSLS
jgi:two-component system NtrC family response regulator